MDARNQTAAFCAFSQRVLQNHMVRKTRRQKQAFRAELAQTLQRAHWPVTIDSGGKLIKSHNVVVGNPRTAQFVCTAHYDTPATLPFPNFLAPQNLVLSLAYQLVLALLIVALPIALPYLMGRLLPPFAGLPLLLWLLQLALLMLALFLMLAGPANPNNANDNTSGVLTLLEAALALPPEARAGICFVFFDNEELGLVGSGLFRSHYGSLRGQTVLNFDCVGNGDTLLFIQPRHCQKDAALQRQLQHAFLPTPGKKVTLDSPRFTFYPSDQVGFARGIAVAAFKRAPIVGLYVNRIHTRRDVVLDEQNIFLLQRGIVRLCQGAGLHAPPAA